MMRLEFGKSAVEARFEAYVERLGEVLGHADRLTPFGGYVSGLFLPVARKSVERHCHVNAVASARPVL